MNLLRKHYDLVRRALAAAMILYLAAAALNLAALARAATEAGRAQPAERIESLERRIDRLDRELERLDAAQRLTRLETYLEATEKASQSSARMFFLTACGILLILAGQVLLFIGRGRSSPAGPLPPAGALAGMKVSVTSQVNAPERPGASFEEAVRVVLANEGSRLVEDGRLGELSRFGLTAEFLRAHGLAHDRAAIEGLTEPEAIQIYRAHIWDKCGLGRIVEQRVATKLFDLAVNLGASRAFGLAQQALNRGGARLAVDGVLGEKTLAALNAAPAEPFLAAFSGLAAEHYQRIAAREPKYQPYLAGWLERAGR